VKAQATLGKLLGRIRRIRGLSVEECEEQLHVPTGTLREAESGRALTDSLIRAVARLHGVDAELLEEGQIRPVPGVEGSTVFLLHSGDQDFSAADLGALEEGLAAGRILATARRSGIVTRSTFAPVPVAGPESRTAARQGYRLANHVRRVLRLGNDPVNDLGLLLENQLGVALFVPDFPSDSVEAASIVDEARIAACAMVSSRIAKSSDPRMRVLLAHELCHVLFDPARPGTVRLSMHHGERNTALEESRAKGFAAEFLLPHDGLVSLLGAPREVNLPAARGLVQKAREFFRTTSEIAVRHLKNHKFISWEVAEELVEEHVVAQMVVHTTLPLPGAYSIDAPAGSLDEDVETSVFLARTVLKRESTIREETVRQLLSKAATENELEATDALLLELDRHLAASNFALFGQALDLAECAKFRPSLLGGLLLLSRAARARLPRETSAFESRALAALKTMLSADDLARVREQIG
jgi:Zn-dependent peptidase ImmA (M78 family)/transcriptional regulator with XRE-family HTH domain